MNVLVSTGIVIERRLCGGSIGGEEGLEECEGMDTLPFGRLHEGGDDAVGVDPLFGSRSEAHLAEDDHLAQGVLGMVVGRRHPWDAKKGKEAFLLRADEVRSQGFCRLEAKGVLTDAFEFFEKLILDPQG